MRSSKNTARLAGFLWLLMAATTFFSLAYIRARLVVSGDAAVTADNLVAFGSLFRAAVASNLVTNLALFFFGLAVYQLFRERHQLLALAFLCSVMISIAIAVVIALGNLGALTVLSQADYLTVFSAEQRSALAMLLLRLYGSGQLLLELFWVLYFSSLGLLIIKSRRLPVILGVLLLLTGAGFLANTFTKLLIPQFYPATFTQLAQLLGALSAVPTILWLLIRGIKEPQPMREARSQASS